MQKSTAARLRRTVAGATRREQYSAATKAALVDVAEELFTEHGYAATSLDAIVGGARVTKGALYHHFSGKQALFEAVFDRVQTEAAQAVQEGITGHTDPWDRALAGLRAFLDVVRWPTYRRIVVQEGPAVLGYQRYREQEERSTFAIVVDIVGSVLNSGDQEADEEMVHTFSRIFFGAMASAGEMVVGSGDLDAASERVEAAIGMILRGMRTLMDSGEGVSPG